MAREYVVVNVPENGINEEVLTTELSALGNLSVSGVGSQWVILDVDETVEDSAIQVVVDAHDGTVLTDEQKVRAAAEVALAQGKTYLRKQLLSASPNVNDIYSTIKTAVDGNAYLQQLVSNQLALMDNSFAWTLNLVSPTALDKQRYILAVEMVVALLS